jgi:hypothetical protein
VLDAIRRPPHIAEMSVDLEATRLITYRSDQGRLSGSV